jgi:hypothetical protein
MKKFGFATVIPTGLTAAVLGFAGTAWADIVANPAVPHFDNHDNADTTDGFVDVPF